MINYYFKICWYSLQIYFAVSPHFDLNISGLVNTLRPRQIGRHFEDDILKCIFFNENV